MTNIDHQALNLFKSVLSAEGHTVKLPDDKRGKIIESLDIKYKYAVCLYLEEVYGYNSSELVDHLDKNEDVRERIGVQEDVHNATISNKSDEEKQYYQPLSNAAKRAVLHLYAEGRQLPESTLSHHGLTGDPDPTVSDTNLTDAVEQEAALQWAELFLENITTPLTFNRTYHKSKDFDRFIGIAAQSALQDVSPRTARNTARYHYPVENIPSGDTLQSYISEVAADEDGEIPYVSDDIITQFNECYHNFFQLLSKLEGIGNDELLLVDTTKVPTTSNGDNPALVSRSKSNSGKYSNDDASMGWGYQLIAAAGENHVYIRSILPYYNQDETQERLEKQLQWINDDPNVDVYALIGDKGYYKKEVVKICRKYLNDDWLICAEVRGDMKRLIGRTPPGDTNKLLTPDFGVRKLYPEPNMFVYPNTSSDGNDNVTLADYEVVTSNDRNRKRYEHETDHQSHIGYLTDRDLDDDSMRKLHVLYQQRTNIEPPIGQIKDIYLPYCESNNPAIRYYMMALAGLFYNFHQLVNRSYSLERGVPLDISGAELLTAITDVALS